MAILDSHFEQNIRGKNEWEHGILKGHRSQPEISLNGQGRTICSINNHVLDYNPKNK